jgi:hypothetical protein
MVARAASSWSTVAKSASPISRIEAWWMEVMLSILRGRAGRALRGAATAVHHVDTPTLTLGQRLLAGPRDGGEAARDHEARVERADRRLPGSP